MYKYIYYIYYIYIICIYIYIFMLYDLHVMSRLDQSPSTSQPPPRDEQGHVGVHENHDQWDLEASCFLEQLWGCWILIRSWLPEYGGNSKSSILDWEFPWNKPSILEYLHLWKPPYGFCMNPYESATDFEYCGLYFQTNPRRSGPDGGCPLGPAAHGEVHAILVWRPRGGQRCRVLR